MTATPMPQPSPPMETRRLTTSVTELVGATQCEFGAARRYELRQGWRLPACGHAPGDSCGNSECPQHGADEMLDRLAKLGDRHEQDFLAQLQQKYGAESVLHAQNFETKDILAAVAQRVPVLFQVPVTLGDLVGRADFVILQTDGSYAVYDTKLARSAQSSAVLQIAAYARALEVIGVPVSRTGFLVLGSGEVTRHAVADVIPVLELIQAKHAELLGRLRADSPVTWGPVARGGSGLGSCGRCGDCEAELAPARDVLLVMGTTTGHRAKLNEAGVYTVEELAQLDTPSTLAATAGKTGLRESLLGSLAAQAQLFLAGEAGDPEGPGEFRVIDTAPFGLLRAPDPADIFFDFEGDPLYVEKGSAQWGLEYLFGWCTRDHEADGRPAFHALWAHDRVAERAAFEQFVDYVLARFTAAPGMHVYHYAPYETTALKRLANEYGTREDELDHLLRSGVFVDLYAVVRGGLRTSGRSLSIKKLEPFYIDALGAARAGVTNAADSITAYADAIAVRDLGDLEEFDRRLALIADYNRYDCESTLHLYNWLSEIATANGVQIQAAPPTLEVEVEVAEPGPVHMALRDFMDLAAHHHEWDDSQAIVARMAWAALDYYRREAKQFWWDHFARLQDPVDDWTGSEIFRPVRAEVTGDWEKQGRERTPSRILRFEGQLEPGNKLRPGSSVMAVYDAPAPDGLKESATAQRKYNTAAVTITEIEPIHGTDRVTLLVKEKLPTGIPEFDDLPIGLTPPTPISTKPIELRLEEFGAEIAGQVQGKQSVTEVAYNESARINLLGRAGAVFDVSDPAAEHDWVGRVIGALKSQDHAVVSVQGPPGAGKTYVASHVIADLVRAGWRIAVVAQSHAVVDNVLSAVVKNGGLAPEQIGKRPGSGQPVPEGMSDLTGPKAQVFYEGTNGGCVVGGTAWALCADNFQPPNGFDLVVIDEAGQFALAAALAVSHASDRILLLGDPQQLPQVSQGTHPEPVSDSVLGWMVGSDATIAPERGFFLDQTWRMHPDLTVVVSELSYAGKLHAVPKTSGRKVATLAPGLHARELDHTGNVATSHQEADEVEAIIRDLVGQQWQLEEGTPARPLEPEDFIVVAPYNAQVHLIRDQLDRAGFTETRVGTVDKFQGQEAPIALVSLATSSAEEAPRGLEFVRNRNRLNVSISRGQHSAFLIYSRHLLQAIPSAPSAIEEQGAFLRLCAAGSS